MGLLKPIFCTKQELYRVRVVNGYAGTQYFLKRRMFKNHFTILIMSQVEIWLQKG